MRVKALYRPRCSGRGAEKRGENEIPAFPCSLSRKGCGGFAFRGARFAKGKGGSACSASSFV